MSIRRGLPKFRQAVDDAKPQVIPKLDLHHFGGEVFPDLSNFLGGELQLSPTSLYQVIDEQRGQVVGFLVAGVVAQVEDLGHDSSGLRLVPGTYG